MPKIILKIINRSNLYQRLNKFHKVIKFRSINELNKALLYMKTTFKSAAMDSSTFAYLQLFDEFVIFYL